MNVRTLCLAMLRMGDASGYEIKTQSVEGDWRHFVDASFGSIYPALKSLEEDGLVTSRSESNPGRPPRKVYAITPSGEAALLDALHEMPAADVFRSEFLLHIVFAERLSREHLRTIIDRRIAEYEDKLSSIEQMLERFPKAGAQWAGNFGRACMSRELDYLRTHRASLEAMGQDPTDRNATGRDALPHTIAAE